MTTLKLQHIDETPNSTVSELMLNGERLCFIIEDGYRKKKIPGETRLYARTYELFARKAGGFFNRYKRAFGHDFVIGFKDAVEFDLVLIHIGNGIENTRSCLLCNTNYHLDDNGNYRGTGSRDAYLNLYGIFKELFRDGKVFIEIDRGNTSEEPVVITPDVPAVPDMSTPEEPLGPPMKEVGFIPMLLAFLGGAIVWLTNGC